MQLSNLVLRLGGSQLHTVPVVGATPAEILILQKIHGSDAVTEVRPTKIDKTRRHASEYERLSNKYDRAASSNEPGEERKSLMASLFPGAMKKLPLTLKEIGLGHLTSSASKKATARIVEPSEGAAPSTEPSEGEEITINLASDNSDDQGLGEPVGKEEVEA